MKSIFRIVLVCKLFVSGLDLVAVHGLAYGAEHKPIRSTSYTLTLIDAEVWGIIDINEKGNVLVSGAKNLWGLSEKSRIIDETRDFVPKFVGVSLIATNPGKYGFGDVYRQEPLEYDEVEVRGSLRL